jgi:hypothetical protein
MVGSRTYATAYSPTTLFALFAMTSTQRVGNNLVLSSILAFFSYGPFEYVAKVTLIVAVALFILDPIPPVSRLLSLVITAAVLVLARLEKTWRQGQPTEIEEKKKEE